MAPAFSAKPLVRVHPAFGVRVLGEDEGLWAVPPEEMPTGWWALSEEEQDAQEDAWARRLILHGAGRGTTSYLYFNTSDKRGLDRVRALNEYEAGSRPHPITCEVTPDSVDAVLETNVGTGYQTVDGAEFLHVHDGWCIAFVCVDDAELRAEFGRSIFDSRHG